MKLKLKSSLAFRYFLRASVIYFLVAFLGLFIAFRIVKQAHVTKDTWHIKNAGRIFNNLSKSRQQTPSKIIETIRKEYPGLLSEDFSIIDNQMQLTGPHHLPPHLSVNDFIEQTPKAPGKALRLPSDRDFLSLRLESGEILFRRVDPPTSDNPPLDRLVNQSIEPTKVSWGGKSPGIERPPPVFAGMTPEIFFTVVFILIFISGYIILCSWALFTFKKTGDMAQGILLELQSGNLKARFPHESMKAVGNIAMSFNEMADEIEKLVKSLKMSESQRKVLLQELVHDLKTPVTSLESLLESLRDHSATINESQRQDFLNTAISEVQYFGRLVTDLLFVSDLVDPTLHIEQKEFDLTKTILDEISVYQSNGVTIHFDPAENRKSFIRGDSQLIKRLIRNALDNAVSFAFSKVNISIHIDPENWRVDFADDGPGLTEEKIKNFGEKSATRKVNHNKGQRISIGLGAYIMKKIALAHGGRVEISNHQKGSKIAGANLSIWLPRSGK